MTVLAEVLLKTAFALKSLRNSLATGGSATTLVDSLLSEPDEFFNNGTLFFISGALANKTAVVTDWDEATFTFTFPTFAPPVNVVAGIRYAVAESRYPREVMVQAINQALSELGPILYRDQTLLTVLDQAEYTLPAGVSDVKRVQFSTNTADPYLWQSPYHYWREFDGKLIFNENYLPILAGRPIRIYYTKAHTAMYADADVLNPTVHPDRVAWTAAWLAALNRTGLAENSEPHSKDVAAIANQMRLMQSRHPIETIYKDVRHADWA
jgi:hypothetical protein